jgi:hypothetical protein
MGYNNYNNNNYGNLGESFLRHLTEFIGETVIIFTTSGGVSGCGFTGVLTAVNCDYVRLVTQQSTSPTCPINNSPCCGELGNTLGNNFNNNNDYDECNANGGYNRRPYPIYTVGSVCDIPIDKIAAFCHNAV